MNSSKLSLVLLSIRLRIWQRLFSCSSLHPVRNLCMSLGVENRQDFKPFDPTEAVAHFSTGPRSYTDFCNLWSAKENLYWIQPKTTWCTRMWGLSRLAFNEFYCCSFFGLCILKRCSDAQKWIISNTESYFGLTHFAAISTAAFSLCILYYVFPARLPILIFTLSNRLMFKSLSDWLMGLLWGHMNCVVWWVFRSSKRQRSSCTVLYSTTMHSDSFLLMEDVKKWIYFSFLLTIFFLPVYSVIMIKECSVACQH